MTLPDTIYLSPDQRSSNLLMAVSNSLRKEADIAYVKQTIVDEVIAKISLRDAEIERLKNKVAILEKQVSNLKGELVPRTGNPP